MIPFAIKVLFFKLWQFLLKISTPLLRFRTPELFSGARAFAEDLAGGKPGQVSPSTPADSAAAMPMSSLKTTPRKPISWRRISFIQRGE